MRPDLIVTWPTSCDYPLWRRWLAADRDHFEKVIVAFSPRPGFTETLDLSAHVRQVLSRENLTFLDTSWHDGWDWRDSAVNTALGESDAEWVWFTEQDFMVRDESLWKAVDAYAECSDLMGIREDRSAWLNGEDRRLHPCCMFARRSVVDKTPRYFGSDPVDHFYRFGKDMEEAGARLVDLDEWAPGSYDHMAGLSHNHELVIRGEPVTYRPDGFAEYLRRCLEREDDLADEWKGQARGWLQWYDEREEVSC